MGQCNGSTCPSSKRKKIIILLVGLDNAGKTCTAKCLLKEPRENIAPTVGFSIVKPRGSKHDVTIYDLGGGQRIRGIWKCYFAESYGLIYVVDASDASRFAECKESLHELIGNPSIAGKPVLLLANKQDNQAALDEVDICEVLDVETIVDKFKCRTKVETCSATAYKGKQVDRTILKGFQWLVKTIAVDYKTLSARVEEDVAKQREVQEKEQAERVERIRLLREEREKLDATLDDLSDGNDAVNPFRPINEIKDRLERSAAKDDDDLRENANGGDKIPSRPLSQNGEVRPPLINGFMATTKEHVSFQGDASEPTAATIAKAKKKRRLGRNNKTAPMEVPPQKDLPRRESITLPPLQLRSSSSGTTISVNTSATENVQRPPSGVKHSWGLAEELEPVDAEQPRSPAR